MTKITAYMASFNGRESVLPDAVGSISPQVDDLWIWMNNFPESKRDPLERSLSQFKNVHVVYSELLAEGSAGDIGDIGKFWFMDQWDGYILTVDDTWIYPPDYVREMIKKVNLYGKKAVVSAHGRIIEGKIKSYYFHDQLINLFNNVPKDVPTNTLGTGVMALHSSILEGSGIDLQIFKHTNMTDIYFPLFLMRKGIPQIIISHRGDWVKGNPKARQLRRISSACARNEELQVKVCNSIKWSIPKLK